MPVFRLRQIAMFLAVVVSFAFAASEADARVGGGSSGGSRGFRTFSSPPSTVTAPKAAPIERSMTQPGQLGNAGLPGTAAGGFFNRPGLLGGLAAGFIGAGLFGMLFGHGLFGNLGGFASFLGLLLQIGLVVIVARLAWAWWQRRNQPAFAIGPTLREMGPKGSQPGGIFGGGGAGAVASEELTTTPEDFDVFERLLGEIQTAYGAEDLAALRTHVTPEMLSYFSEDLAKNASRGVINQVSGVKLLQGDLSEAWREGDTDYATVAMRFSLTDRMVDRKSGRTIEGDATTPEEVTELWTFRRSRGSEWMLSAIQQA